MVHNNLIEFVDGNGVWMECGSACYEGCANRKGKQSNARQVEGKKKRD